MAVGYGVVRDIAPVDPATPGGVLAGVGALFLLGTFLVFSNVYEEGVYRGIMLQNFADGLAGSPLDDEGRRGDLGEDVRELVRGEPIAEGIEDGAEFRTRKRHEDDLAPVVQHRRDAVTSPDAAVGERVRQAVDFRVDRGVGPALLAVGMDQCVPIGVPRCG